MPVFQQQPPPSQRSKPNPTPKRVQGRQGHYAAAAAAVMFACSVAAAHAAQHVAASYLLGTWSTASLSEARQNLAAASLPNLGVAIFAGGYVCTSCHEILLIFVSLRVVLCALPLGELDAFALLFCKSHAFRSGHRLIQRCGHLQRDVWNMDHCSSQRSSKCSCSHIAAECRSRDLRWWLRYVLPC
jgi:hypothetical protein